MAEPNPLKRWHKEETWGVGHCANRSDARAQQKTSLSALKQREKVRGVSHEPDGLIHKILTSNCENMVLTLATKLLEA
jgi:hypothetical protein